MISPHPLLLLRLVDIEFLGTNAHGFRSLGSFPGLFSRVIFLFRLPGIIVGRAFAAARFSFPVPLNFIPALGDIIPPIEHQATDDHEEKPDDRELKARHNPARRCHHFPGNLGDPLDYFSRQGPLV